jgi:hypothetical protein
MLEGQDNQGEKEATFQGLSKKYPWWSPSAVAGRITNPEELAEVFERKNTFI